MKYKNIESKYILLTNKILHKDRGCQLKSIKLMSNIVDNKMNNYLYLQRIM